MHSTLVAVTGGHHGITVGSCCSWNLHSFVCFVSSFSFFINPLQTDWMRGALPAAEGGEPGKHRSQSPALQRPRHRPAPPRTDGPEPSRRSRRLAAAAEADYAFAIDFLSSKGATAAGPINDYPHAADDGPLAQGRDEGPESQVRNAFCLDSWPVVFCHAVLGSCECAWCVMDSCKTCKRGYCGLRQEKFNLFVLHTSFTTTEIIDIAKIRLDWCSTLKRLPTPWAAPAMWHTIGVYRSGVWVHYTFSGAHAHYVPCHDALQEMRPLSSAEDAFRPPVNRAPRPAGGPSHDGTDADPEDPSAGAADGAPSEAGTSQQQSALHNQGRVCAPVFQISSIIKHLYTKVSIIGAFSNMHAAFFTLDSPCLGNTDSLTRLAKRSGPRLCRALLSPRGILSHGLISSQNSVLASLVRRSLGFARLGVVTWL